MNQWFKDFQCRDSTNAIFSRIANKAIKEVEQKKRDARLAAIKALDIKNSRITIKKGVIIVLRVTFDNFLVIKVNKNKADQKEREVDPRGLLKTINKMSQS